MTIILTIIFTLLAVYLTIRPYLPAPLAAGLLLVSLYISSPGLIPQSVLIGWTCLALAATITDILRPHQISKATNGTVYISVGSLAGMLIGMSMLTHPVMLYTSVGALLGAFVGMLLFGRSNAGRAMHFPSPSFRRYAVAKIVSIAATYAVVGVSFYCLVLLYYPQSLVK